MIFLILLLAVNYLKIFDEDDTVRTEEAREKGVSLSTQDWEEICGDSKKMSRTILLDNFSTLESGS